MEKLNLPKLERPLEVLAVDDDATNLLVIEKMLTPHSCKVLKATSGQEALDQVWKGLPDVILLDVMMPGMSGFEVCKKLKSSESTRLVPIIIVTALQEKEDRIKGIQAGCDDFISKPIDRLELLARVHALGQVKRLNDDLDHAEAVVLSLARAVEAKDHTTGDHCDRLIRLNNAFGKHLGLEDKEISTLERASIVHDVGKIGVPDSILLKPGKLTEDEWEIMRQHPILGEEICHPLRSLADVCPIWDSIAFLARVFQIIDAFDAMSSERPYKSAFSLEKTIKTLRDETSKGYWDPELMKKFIEFIEKKPNKPS